MSLKNDGTDSTVTLTAGAGADINQVTFQYRIDPRARGRTSPPRRGTTTVPSRLIGRPTCPWST